MTHTSALRETMMHLHLMTTIRGMQRSGGFMPALVLNSHKQHQKTWGRRSQKFTENTETIRNYEAIIGHQTLPQSEDVEKQIEQHRKVLAPMEQRVAKLRAQNLHLIQRANARWGPFAGVHLHDSHYFSHP